MAKYEESTDSNWVYYYHDGEISKFGPGVYLTTASGFSQLPNIYDIIRYRGQLIACGEFDRVGNASISGIMAWNGATWESLGSGLTGNLANTPPIQFPHQLYVWQDELYVVGNFSSAGGVAAKGIAKWDGENWYPMSAGFNGTVYSIVVFENELYAGGSFTMSGSTEAKGIAKWNGSIWESPGFGFEPANSNDFSFVHTLKVIDNQLHIAGGLKKIRYEDGTEEPCGGLVAFDGIQLNTYNGGVQGNDIEALIKKDSTTLLVGGGVFNSGYLGETVPMTSIFEPVKAMELRLSPNPTTGWVYFPPDLQNGVADLIVTDLYGRVVKRIEGLALDQAVDLSHLPSGVYTVRVYSGKENYRGNLILRGS